MSRVDSDHPDVKVGSREIIDLIISGKIRNKLQLRKAKTRISRKSSFPGILGNSKILEYATEDEKKKLSLLIRKPVRTISGVAIAAVMCRPGECPGRCIYCPNFEGAPRSYTGKEPAAMRAEMFDHDPYVQMMQRLKQLEEIGHKTSKVEIIIMGGTFPSMDWGYQKNFVKRCFDALNMKNSDDLKSAQKLNETSERRCVALTIETRPDFAKKENIDKFLELGATRIEVGVQTTDDGIYEQIERGHTISDVVESTRLLKDAGFKVCYHYMPGLMVDAKRDIELFSRLFDNPDFRPDMLKIYPTLVVRGTRLHEMWKKGEYKPYSNEEAVDTISRMKELVPEYVRIMRVQRDIPAYNIEAGANLGNLREVVQKRCDELGIRCKCIRCREAGHNLYKKNKAASGLRFHTVEYDASGGREIFISEEDESGSILSGFVRMRYPSSSSRDEIDGNSAIIRELKVVGNTVPVGHKSSGEGNQHKGLGKKLMSMAEQKAIKDGKQKMLVISAVGTRAYYEKIGYVREGPYMSKAFNL